LLKIEDRFKYFLFDCDGVILNSNRIKTAAFRVALEKENELLIEKFIRYHKKNQGIDRYVKIKYFIEKIKKIKFDKDIYDAILKKYAVYCKRELLHAQLIPGILDLLKKLNLNPSNKCFVVSGSDQKELIEIFKKRYLNIFFSEILGSPKTKYENVQYLINNNKINNSTIFFGDAESDYQTAKNFKFSFVYVYGASDWLNGMKICKKDKTEIIENFL
tara:strand:- start:1247 stop:1897 length:651 start_codon:yes stop_codon:yes gene_type:complete